MRIDSVCVLGGGGFVGWHLVTRLNNMGKHVRVITRRRERHKQLLVLPFVEVVEGDVHDPATLERLFADRDAVVNLVGILNEKGHRGEGFRHVHVDLSKKVLDACKKTGVKRLLHMSALGADQGNAPSHYLRTKGEAENHVHTFGQPDIAVTSFRPSVIFGRDDGLFNRFAALLKISPVLPLACPNARFAPVYVGDVAERMGDALEDRKTFGQRYNLCGPEVWALREIVAYIQRLKGWHRLVVPLPDRLARWQANVLEFVPGKPFSRDNYASLRIDSVCPEGATCPTPIEAVVPHYIGDENRQTRYQTLRRAARRSHRDSAH
ncbi:complex I NDUFA9 subunit family protein [Halofilum ochraceum]|uniref:complex I NDUFA9 subunit family protein n=1 Tax=Halofilum ochraceum TaxID=1611323 RepID=UPI0008DAF6DB|nr:complex I NDUFA9 subunit family protein [Halofilum ochraceum]